MTRVDCATGSKGLSEALVGLGPALVLGLALMLVGVRAAQADLLKFAQDEGSVERAIAEYLTQRGITHSIRVAPNDHTDWFISVDYQLDDAPDISFFVDTVPSGEVDGRITERAITVSAWPHTGIPYDRVGSFLQFINGWAKRNWAPPQLYVDDDNDLEFMWMINIPGPKYTVDAEQVVDALIRMTQAWEQMYRELVDTGLIDPPAPEAEPARPSLWPQRESGGDQFGGRQASETTY